MQYDYNEIIKMLEQNQQQYTNMIFELNKYTQTRLENINNNFQLRMAQINLELQDICMRSSLQQQQITSAFNALNNKVIRIYQNSVVILSYKTSSIYVNRISRSILQIFN